MESPDGQDFVLVDKAEIEQSATDFLPLPRYEISKIRHWLQPTEYLADSSEYKKHLNSHLRGTGNWISNTEAYQKWHVSRDHGALWIKAIAGAGKSVIAAMIASKLASAEKVPVLFFFFRQIVATNHHPQSMCRDFIAQLLDHSPVLQKTMKAHMDSRHTIEGLSTSALWADFTEALMSLPKVYCVVDALDEMDIDQESFLDDLVRLGKSRPSSIKLLMTSRPLPRIEQSLKDASVLQIRLESRLVDMDIALYVDHRLNQRPDFDIVLRRAVKEEIGKKSQGSFLYARLMMDELTSHFDHMIPDIKFIQRSLDWLPITLEDMYNGMLLDHSLRSRVPQDLQVTILRWVTHSSRPLRLLELATMLDSLSDKKGQDTKALVRTACGPLLEILEDETVSVIHHSFTEFLLDGSREGRKAPGSIHPQFPVISPPTTHRLIALTCFGYITSGRLGSWRVEERTKDSKFYNKTVAKQQELHMQNPFLAYAVGNVLVHIKKMGEVDSVLYSMLDEFMLKGNADFEAFLDLAWRGPPLTETTPIHVAAWSGLTTYLRHLIQKGHDLNVPDANHRAPLSWASANGHADAVALLLEHGAEIDVDDFVGLKPLHYAARANHHGVVKLLLAAGVSPLTPKTKENPGRRCGNAPTTRGETPLLYACQSGNTETVQEMMPYLKAEDLNRSLCVASRSGKTEVVKLLLTSPEVLADPPNVENTPLFLASGGMHLEIMRSLLEKGADPMKRSENFSRHDRGFFTIDDMRRKEKHGPTPFHALCGASQERGYLNNKFDEDLLRKCFQTLYEAGADIDAIDNWGKTPLHYSVCQSDYGAANNVISILLLEAGADPRVADKEGNTPLHLVRLHSASARTIAALIKHGADINAKRATDGRTMLHTAVESIHILDLKVVIPFVKDWNVKDSKGNTPLHIILSKSYNPDKVLGDLIEAGADVNARNLRGEAPLHVARELRDSSNKVLDTLLKAGADLEAKDNAGRTVLLYTLMQIGGHLDTTAVPKSLLNHGAKVDTRDHNGNGVLHAVCRKNADTGLLRLLLDAGADPQAVNHAGNSLLHEIAIDYNAIQGDNLKGSLQLLLDNGVSPNTRNNLGQTPLHIVFSSNYTQSLGGKTGQLDLFLRPEFRALLDTADNNGVRPIDLAATFSEVLVAELLRSGADPTLSTNEGRTILHTAARARQSNIIGLLLSHLTSTNRADIIDLPDSRGRTALHDVGTPFLPL